MSRGTGEGSDRSAVQFLESDVRGDRSFRHTTAQTHGLDKYRRTIGEVILLDGMNLNQELRSRASAVFSYFPDTTLAV
jgi:hypothetical protein